jgi:hypothetical protein
MASNIKIALIQLYSKVRGTLISRLFFTVATTNEPLLLLAFNNLLYTSYTNKKD